MSNAADKSKIGLLVDSTLESLSRPGYIRLGFPAVLEDRFEEDTRKQRSFRMWLEGLIAILGLNGCLLVDYVLVHDIALLSVVRHTMVVTPLALMTNMLVKRNPTGWMREGVVAASMVAICLMNLMAEGNSTPTATLFGEICVLITALFVGVVMRLRFPYVAASLTAMLFAGTWFLKHGREMRLGETVIGASLFLVGLGIILVASYSLEREERRNYLLCLQRDLQAEELALSNAALQRLSTVDSLTGLPNRRALEERIERMWTACARSKSRISAVVVDVDHFKRVNDIHGHLYGDETLQRIGTLLPKALRSPEDMAARFGGEEFILLLPYSEAGNAITVAERARKLVETAGTPCSSTTTRNPMMWITVSCGVSSCIPGDGATWTDLVAAADEALYTAKRNGRNRVEFRECESELSWCNDIKVTSALPTPNQLASL